MVSENKNICKTVSIVYFNLHIFAIEKIVYYNHGSQEIGAGHA
jgi:hypothetical protein